MCILVCAVRWSDQSMRVPPRHDPLVHTPHASSWRGELGCGVRFPYAARGFDLAFKYFKKLLIDHSTFWFPISSLKHLSISNPGWCVWELGNGAWDKAVWSLSTLQWVDQAERDPVTKRHLCGKIKNICFCASCILGTPNHASTPSSSDQWTTTPTWLLRKDGTYFG